jgi:hypothetical protein
MLSRLLFLAASNAKLIHVVSRGAWEFALKKKKDAADAGVVESGDRQEACDYDRSSDIPH